MTLDEMQAEVHAWIDRFEEGYWHPLSMLARLTEEVGELAREVNHRYGEKPKKESEPENDISLELADILFVVTCFANSLDLSLEEAFRAMMEKYRQRDAGRWSPKRKSGPDPEIK
ncbi:MAG: nucleotide pyrophosphohydrolase [bacterium]|jgi:NTP pyrophosphatase (non-canonical NTP hydrolase)